MRDALTSNYPKLVGLLEAAFNRIQTESRLKVGLVYLSSTVTGLCRLG